MSRLVIVGARAMGRETCAYAQESGIVVKGFLDDNFNALDDFNGYPKILNSVENYIVENEDVFVIALGDGELRKKYAEIIKAKGGKFINVVHPSAYIGKNVKLGEGCIICPNVIITNDTTIGRHVVINVGSTINHDNQIGDYVTICPGCHLAGRIVLKESVFLGTAVTLIPDIVLGKDVYVAAGAVVVKSYQSGRLMGVPARLIEKDC